jgi:transcriptional regulator
MYKLPYFVEEDIEKVIAMMKENSFAVISGFGEHYPVATHIPLEIEVAEDGEIFLKGHMMRNSDHHKAFLKNNKVLVVFNGPHCFVSASWYVNPASGSTWNYMTVHAKGKITFSDEDGTYNAVKKITNKYEGIESIAAFDKLPKEYIEQMVKAIVGFSIEVESIENVFKLSQNQDEPSKNNIIKHLQERGDEQSQKIAEEIQKRL